MICNKVNHNFTDHRMYKQICSFIMVFWYKFNKRQIQIYRYVLATNVNSHYTQYLWLQGQDFKHSSLAAHIYRSQLDHTYYTMPAALLPNLYRCTSLLYNLSLYLTTHYRSYHSLLQDRGQLGRGYKQGIQLYEVANVILSHTCLLHCRSQAICWLIPRDPEEYLQVTCQDLQ